MNKIIITEIEFINVSDECEIDLDTYLRMSDELYYCGRANFDTFKHSKNNKYEKINNKPVFDASEACFLYIDEFKLISDHLNPSNRMIYDELIIEKENYYLRIGLNYKHADIDYTAEEIKEENTDIDEGPEGAPLWWLMQQLANRKAVY